MTQFAVSTTTEQSIYAALELSKNSWLLAIQVAGRDKPSLHPIKGGNAEGLMAKLDAARDRVAQVRGQRPQVTLCYEAGYDGFWLARLLDARGIECLVIEPASLQVNRRARRVKTDRIDVESILHTLPAGVGERTCSRERERVGPNFSNTGDPLMSGCDAVDGSSPTASQCAE